MLLKKTQPIDLYQKLSDEINEDRELLKLCLEFGIKEPSSNSIELLLSNTNFRDRLSLHRFNTITQRKDSLKALKNKPNNIPGTIDKNFAVMREGFSNEELRKHMNNRVDRMALLAKLAKSINNENEVKTITIGPRSEYEVFTIISELNTPVAAIDLFSYSEYITECDLMSLPATNEWDIIILGSVLPYLNNPEAAIKHLCNCLSPGGFLIIGSSRTLMTLEKWQKLDKNGISKNTKIVFSTEDELSDFIDSSSCHNLYEVSRTCSIISCNKNEISISQDITCMFRKEIATGNQKVFTSRKGEQISPLKFMNQGN